MSLDQDIWIIGAGGIGSSLAEKYRETGIKAKVISRPEYDMTQPEQVKQFFDSVNSLPSIVINTIGMLYNSKIMPEKSLMAFKTDFFYENLRVNTLPVMWIAQALSKKLNKKDELIFITLSARISSISDNNLGGWYSYRASKCALNMFIKNISLEWSWRFPKTIICGYHPGTVDTYLSKPFKKNIRPEKLSSPKQAADHLFSYIQKVTPEMTGGLFDWQGKRIEF